MFVVHPRPCTLYYLGHCREGTKCTHGHDYTLSAEHLTELRTHAKNSPCSLLNKGKGCHLLCNINVKLCASQKLSEGRQMYLGTLLPQRLDMCPSHAE